MVEYQPLDRTIVQGTVYTSPDRALYVIGKLGTDSTGAGYLEIEGKPTGKLHKIIAPLVLDETNLLGPLVLGDLFYIIPPETEFQWKGDTGSKARLVGKVGLLEPGEAVPTEFLARRATQYDHYRTYAENTLTLKTDEPWSKCIEKPLISITPLTKEEYLFDHAIMLSVANVTITAGDFFLIPRFFEKPFEWIAAKEWYRGIDSYYCPRPPKDATVIDAFSFVHWPIRVPGDVEFNIQGHPSKDLTPPTGTALSFTITLGCIFKRLV